MNRPLIALALVLLLPAVASGQSRLGPSDAPRGVPSETQRVDPDPGPGRAPSQAQDKAPGGRPGAPAIAKPAPSPNPSPAPSPQQDTDAPMRFEVVREGPAESCGKNCRTWIAATGRITPDTARDFLNFLRGKELRGAVIVLDSNGGTVTSGLDLGRAFRRLDMTTTVGKTTPLPASTDGEMRATLSPRGTCASMCAFALLGGARRHVPAEARVLVHQIWPSSKRDDAAAQTYTAENLVSLQRSLGTIARFTTEMGVDIELFELALRIPPWERMRALSPDELKRLRVRTVENPFDPPMTASGPVTLPPLSDVTTVSVPAAGAWTLTERDGLRGLARRHPLTIEGDDIGSFELLFACGDTPNAYALQYTEKRRKPDARERLAKVLVVGGKERVPLTIQSSAKGDTDLESVARGAVPLAMLNTFAETGDRSIVVSTETSGNVRTLIRIGNTGLGAALPQLAAACRK